MSLVRRSLVVLVAGASFGVSELATATCGGGPNGSESLTVSVSGTATCGTIAETGTVPCPARVGASVMVESNCYATADIALSNGGLVSLTSITTGDSFDVQVNAYEPAGTGSPINSVNLVLNDLATVYFGVFPDQAVSVGPGVSAGAYTGTVDVIVTGAF